MTETFQFKKSSMNGRVFTYFCSLKEFMALSFEIDAEGIPLHATSLADWLIRTEGGWAVVSFVCPKTANLGHLSLINQLS